MEQYDAERYILRKEMHGMRFVFRAIHVTRRRPAYFARHAYSVSCGKRGPASGPASGSSGSPYLGPDPRLICSPILANFTCCQSCSLGIHGALER